MECRTDSLELECDEHPQKEKRPKGKNTKGQSGPQGARSTYLRNGLASAFLQIMSTLLTLCRLRCTCELETHLLMSMSLNKLHAELCILSAKSISLPLSLSLKGLAWQL